MARIRYIKPDFFKDEDLSFLEHKLRIFFAGLWCWADKRGRMEYRPKFLKAEIFPYEDFDAVKALALLENPNIPERPDKKFITIYQHNGCKYIQINEFSKHQTPHKTEKESSIPSPNGQLTVKEPLYNEHETNIHVPNGDGDGDYNGDGDFDWNFEKAKFLDDTRWQEDYIRKRGGSPERLVEVMKQFVDDIELGEKQKTAQKLKWHFLNKYRSLPAETVSNTGGKPPKVTF